METGGKRGEELLIEAVRLSPISTTTLAQAFICMARLGIPPDSDFAKSLVENGEALDFVSSFSLLRIASDPDITDQALDFFGRPEADRYATRDRFLREPRGRASGEHAHAAMPSS